MVSNAPTVIFSFNRLYLLTLDELTNKNFTHYSLICGCSGAASSLYRKDILIKLDQFKKARWREGVMGGGYIHCVVFKRLTP